MVIQTEQKKNKKVPLATDKINLVLYTIGLGKKMQQEFIREGRNI